MPLTYSDLEKMKLGEQAQIEQAANQKIEEGLNQQELQLDAEEQNAQAKNDEALTQDAMSVIQQMEQLDKDGKSHIKLFNSLPDVLKQKVTEILSQQSFNPIGGQQQQEADLTQQAKQIAQLS